MPASSPDHPFELGLKVDDVDLAVVAMKVVHSERG
jgi:hypothetical protein